VAIKDEENNRFGDDIDRNQDKEYFR
jgi:hypothetical protein